MNEYVIEHGLIVNGNATASVVTASFIGNLQGSASYATSASWAPTGGGVVSGGSYNISASWASASISASYAPSTPSSIAISASWASSSISSSYALTASFALNGGNGTSTSGYANSFMLMGG